MNTRQWLDHIQVRFRKNTLACNDNARYTYPGEPAYTGKGLDTREGKANDGCNSHKNGSACCMIRERIKGDRDAQEGRSTSEDIVLQ